MPPPGFFRQGCPHQICPRQGCPCQGCPRDSVAFSLLGLPPPVAPRNWPRRLLRNCAPVCFVVLVYEGPCQSSPLVSPARVQTYIYICVYTSPCPCQGCPRQGCPHQGCLRGSPPPELPLPESARQGCPHQVGPPDLPARVPGGGCPARVALPKFSIISGPRQGPDIYIYIYMLTPHLAPARVAPARVAPTRVVSEVRPHQGGLCQGCPWQGCPRQGCPARVAPARVARQDAPGPRHFLYF